MLHPLAPIIPVLFVSNRNPLLLVTRVSGLGTVLLTTRNSGLGTRDSYRPPERRYLKQQQAQRRPDDPALTVENPDGSGELRRGIC